MVGAALRLRPGWAAARRAKSSSSLSNCVSDLTLIQSGAVAMYAVPSWYQSLFLFFFNFGVAATSALAAGLLAWAATLKGGRT